MIRGYHYVVKWFYKQVQLVLSEDEIRSYSSNNSLKLKSKWFLHSSIDFSPYFECYFSFPKHKAKDLSNPDNWYIHKVTEDSYLMSLHSKPYYPKLVENSIVLSKLPTLHLPMINKFMANKLKNKEKELLELSTLGKYYNDLGT